MIITFLDPPVERGQRIPERVFGCAYGLYPIPNIFLLYSAAVLEDEGHRVSYINGPGRGWNTDNLKKFLLNDKSDVYVIYSVYLSQEIDKTACRMIKELRPEAQVVFVGPAPTYYPEDYLIEDTSFVVRGEPETTLAHLIDNINDPSGINGISYLDSDEAVHNPSSQPEKDLDKLPYPARHLLNEENYFNPKFRNSNEGRFTALLTSRGCPYRCIYCVPNSLSFAREIEYRKTHEKKPPYRARSAENVLGEFRLLKKQGYRQVSIIDDEFAISKERAHLICNGLESLGISWGCLSRADSLDEELIRHMAAAGCNYVDVGVESFRQDILDDIRKDLDVATIEKTSALLKKAGIMAKLNILIGSSPLETKDTIRDTVEHALSLKPDSIMFSICNPFPGTEMYSIARNRNYFVKGDYYPVDVQKESTISLPFVSKNDLEKEVRRANRKFFLSLRFILGNIYRLKSPRTFFRGITTLRKKLF